MQNWFSTFALVSWPFAAFGIFSSKPLSKAIIWTILGAQLLLPVGAIIKFQMVPQFDKNSIPSFCILLGCSIFARGSLRFWNGLGLVEILILMNLLSPVLTSLSNGDATLNGIVMMPGVGLYDGISAVESELVFLIPFFIARQFLWRMEDTKDIFRAIVFAELLYTIPLLFEIRFSPQLHFWVYGYSPGDFLQSVRDGGFRPTVFMGHGLVVAFFLMMAIVASSALWRTRMKVATLPAWVAGALLGVVLILCKSLGATVYSLALAPLVRFARPGLQMKIAIAMVSIALLYPALRALDWFPTRLITGTAFSLSPERAQSIQFRFDNEDQLLARALERPWFGWGRFGRNRVLDPVSGKDDSVIDGRWIETLGQFGLFGFIAEFGLLSLTVYRAAFCLRLARSNTDKLFLSALSLIVSVVMLDSLPNSSFIPWTVLLCGTLYGRAETLKAMASPRASRRAPMPMSGLPVRQTVD
jgi:hypothetical protein